MWGGGYYPQRFMTNSLQVDTTVKFKVYAYRLYLESGNKCYLAKENTAVP